jgi:hypothetical protein
MATDFFKIGQATGQQFVDVTGAIQKGLEAGLKPFAEYEKSRKERVAALGRILQSTPNLEELPKIPAQYSPEISKWASNAKNQYADAARTLVQASADSAEYREAVQKMNNIKTAFVNLDNQLNGIREERIEYLDDYRNGIVSKGFKNSDIEAAYGQSGKIVNIDANGNVSMSGLGGKAFKWSERQEHYNINPYIQKSMVDISTNAKSNGLKGISFTEDEYKEQLKAIMSDPKIGNIQGLKSLVYDDIDGTPLNITQTNPEILQLLEAETPDLPLIKQKLVDILAPALADVNKTSVSKYNEALQASDPVNKLNNQRAQGKKRFKDTLTDINIAFSRKNKEYFVNKKIDNKPIESVSFKRDEDNNPIAVFDVVVSTAGGKLTTKEIIVPYKRGEVIKDLTTTFVKNQFGSDAITDYGLSQYDDIVRELQTARAAKKIRNQEFAQ